MGYTLNGNRTLNELLQTTDMKEYLMWYIFGAFIIVFCMWFALCPSGAVSVHICTLGLLQ